MNAETAVSGGQLVHLSKRVNAGDITGPTAAAVTALIERRAIVRGQVDTLETAAKYAALPC